MDILLFVTPPVLPPDALALTRTISQLIDASVMVLVVGDTERDPKAGEEIQARVKEALAPAPVDIQFRRGPTTGRLVAAARERSYDLVILGMRQISHLQRLLSGSRVRSVMRHSYGSVLVAKASRPALGHMLICTSGFSGAERVIQQGARLAQGAGARVTLLHVASSFPSMFAGLPEIDETLANLLKSDTPLSRHLRRGSEILADHDLSIELKLRHGLVADEILLESTLGKSDMIILGAPGRGRFVPWLLGDVTWQVVERAECHVLVVKQPVVDYEIGG